MRAKDGDTVRVHYSGAFEDGSVFDGSGGDDPLQFTLGEDQVIPGFDAAVSGMEVGSRKQETFSPEQGYGELSQDLVFELPLDELRGHGVDPQPGQTLELEQDDGSTFSARVTAVSADAVTLDANHELAGKTLVFDITLVEIA